MQSELQVHGRQDDLDRGRLKGLLGPMLIPSGALSMERAHVTHGKASGGRRGPSKGRAKPCRKAASVISACSVKDGRGPLTLGREMPEGDDRWMLNRERELGLDRRETG